MSDESPKSRLAMAVRWKEPALACENEYTPPCRLEGNEWGRERDSVSTSMAALVGCFLPGTHTSAAAERLAMEHLSLPLAFTARRSLVCCQDDWKAGHNTRSDSGAFRQDWFLFHSFPRPLSVVVGIPIPQRLRGAAPQSRARKRARAQSERERENVSRPVESGVRVREVERECFVSNACVPLIWLVSGSGTVFPVDSRFQPANFIQLVFRFRFLNVAAAP